MEISVTDAAQKYLTPYKLGRPVLTGSGQAGTFDALAVDCPFIFYHNGRFHMMYVGFDGTGYQTGLAVSDDLISWRRKGPILKRDDHVGWDRVGAAGTWILKSTNSIWDLPTLKKWMANTGWCTIPIPKRAMRLAQPRSALPGARIRN